MVWLPQIENQPVLRSKEIRVTPEEIKKNPTGAALKFFPEMQNSMAWDYGCKDWPEVFDLKDSNTKIKSKALKNNISLHVEKDKGQLRVYAQVYLYPEKGESIESVFQSVVSDMSTGETYAKWVMPGINEKPNGGHYFVSIEKLRNNLNWRSIPNFFLLTGDYVFKILWFERSGGSSIQFYSWKDMPPPCTLFEQRDRSFAPHKMIFRMTPREGLLDFMIGEAWMFVINGRVEMRLRLSAKPARAPYELLPEALVKSELTVRARKIFENYLDYRRR